MPDVREEDLRAGLRFLGGFLIAVALLALAGWAAWWLISDFVPPAHRPPSPRAAFGDT
jgi:hypothetical protein